MKILITTGIYPPKIGGPAQYAKNLKESLESLGFSVRVRTYDLEDRLPTGIRHLFFLLKIIPSVVWSDVVIALDTFSVGLPSVLASKIFGCQRVIRTGGDFLWEQYVERSKKKVLLSKFYLTETPNFTLKEKIIFSLTGWTLRNVDRLVFSTDWQRQIFLLPYKIEPNKTAIIENYFGPKESDLEPSNREFVASTRKLVWKNLDLLESVFNNLRGFEPKPELFTHNLPYDKFLDKMKDAYSVILVSLGDISPNMIMDAIRLNRPFICTKEVGIYDRVKDAGVFVDPQNPQEIERAVRYFLTEDGYKEAKARVRGFDFVHTWSDIAREFVQILQK